MKRGDREAHQHCPGKHQRQCGREADERRAGGGDDHARRDHPCGGMLVGEVAEGQLHDRAQQIRGQHQRRGDGEGQVALGDQKMES